MPSISNSSTLSDFVASGSKTTISYDKFSTIQTVGNIKFPVYQVLNDYLYELKGVSREVELNKEEYDRYKYRPKLLAYDVYGSTEMDFIILAINNMADMKDFDLKNNKVMLISPRYMTTFISSIYNAEREFIKQNRK